MRVLFVCLGNICRSPTAEAVFRKKCADAGLQVEFDSAGTADYHVGERSDPRSIEHARVRGYSMTHRGRQVRVQDFVDFDLVLAMDASNFANLKKLAPLPDGIAKLKHVTEVLSDVQEVPDPYYGVAQDFEAVIDLLERCADGWIARWK